MPDRGPAPDNFIWCGTPTCRVQIRKGGYRWCSRCRGAWGAARRDEGTYGDDWPEDEDKHTDCTPEYARENDDGIPNHMDPEWLRTQGLDDDDHDWDDHGGN